ncbi:MAG: MDR family MFS transporter [Dehalococcoidales bacterium]|nr:MDR family MFS transporter [Dehalococcoidales bacterium]
MATEIQSQPVGLRSLPRKQIMITFVGVMLAMFLSSLDQTVVGTAMPRIISDLGGFSHYTWVTSIYIIASAVAIPITGKLTDMYGRKFFYLGGLIIFVLASLFCGLSNTMAQIIIFRGVQGIGAGVMMANAFTVIGDIFPPADRGKYQGFMSGVFGLSSIIGPTLGGYVTDSLSWHWVFFINIPLGLLIILLFFFFFPNFRPDKLKHNIDYPGLILLILTVVPAMLALSWGGVEYAWGSWQIVGMFVFSAVMLALFIFAESRSREPIIPLSLFKNRIVAISELVIFFTAFGMFGGIIFIPLFFQGVLGATATTSGNFLTPMMLGMVAGSLISGQLLSRAGGHYKLLGAIGIGIMGIGIFLLSSMTAETTNASAVVNIIITGIGLGVTMPLYTIAVQNAVPYNVLGVATSSTAFFRSIGGAVGLAVFGSVMNNQFALELTNKLPDAVKALIPVGQLDTLAKNPQALMSPEAQAQLQVILNHADPSGRLFQQILQALREALSSALSQVFLFALFAVVIAFLVNFFIKEIALRKHH